ncbi:DNA helicase-like protein [Streptococcus suis]|uniref:DNA helicase-like protein n=3 Tax=Streptococcus suis TaxID=1307 RepID=A0A0Z8PHF5_STRSU|nr:DEAD/DEAH box helicase [Streptococcus suis]NQG28660.1 DEAD/DEAH box helicase [Streptococcus suis]CYW45873.1 DNA helicase-like protein [Streptococcus suis]
MVNNGKGMLTRLSKDKTFSDVLLHLLFIKETLTLEEAEYLFSVAIVFIEEFEREKKRYYIEFAYAIIVRTCLKLGDYRALFDFSINFGFYPVARKIFQDKLINEVSFQDILSNIRLDGFNTNDKINTLEQYKTTQKILESHEKNFAFIAPTSFGKSEIIYQHILNNSEVNNIGIIVPTKALIDQVYREIKKVEGLNRKIIIHDQNYDSESDSRVLAIITQERGLRLLEQNMIFDSLYIDEAHELFSFDFGKKLSNRSVLLTRLIRISRELNSEINIYYFSPIIQDVNSLQLKNDHVDIDYFSIKNNLKVLDIRFVNNENSEFVYEPHLGSLYKIDEIDNNLNYIVNKSKNYKKSLHFLYKPRFIEQYAKELFENLPETRENSQTLVPLIEELKEIVHPKFKLIKYLEKGIVYLHGRLPTNIRNYLLKYVREDLGVKHFIANSVVLAGMNLPIDSLFYISGFSNLNDLYNLIGRVNRLNEIFGNQGSIDRILIPIYFVEMQKYPQNGKLPLQNKVLSLRNELKDEVKNPLLEESKISESNRETSYEIIELENEVINNFHNPDFISRLTRAGAQQVLNYSVDGLKILEDVIENYYETANYQNIYLDILHKIKEIFFDPFVNQSNDKAIFYKYFKPTNNVKRLRFDSTIRYYAGFIQSSYSDLRIRIENQVRYWNRIVEKNKLNQEEVKYLQYIGAQFGDKAYNSSDYNDSRAKVYVDIRDYIERIDDLYNLAIIKLQVDDDFVDYEINLLVNTLKEFGIISEEQFNLFVFGTIENTELKILQLGINKALYLKLKRDNQISNIIFDEYKNPKANRELKSYIELKSGIEKFELEQFFL